MGSGKALRLARDKYGLENFEKKILETQKRAAPDVAPQRNYKLPIFSFVLLGLLFTAGIFYWSQNRMAIEPEPPLVVDIERSPATQYHAPAMPVKTESIVSVKPFDFQSHFQLNGIVWDIQSPMALINGRIVKAGDWLDNRVIVKEIGRDSATLDRGGEAFVLKLKV